MSRAPSPPSLSPNRRKVSPHTVGSEAGLRSLFLLPALLFAAFIALPLLALILRAAMTGNLLQQLAQPIVLSALRLSALTSLASLLIIVLVGTPTAYLLARSTFPGKRLLDVFIDVPLALPPVVCRCCLAACLRPPGSAGTVAPAARHRDCVHDPRGGVGAGLRCRALLRALCEDRFRAG